MRRERGWSSQSRARAASVSGWPAQSLRAACEGIRTVLHLQFTIALGGGSGALEALHKGNVAGTRNLLAAATEACMRRWQRTAAGLCVLGKGRPDTAAGANLPGRSRAG